MSVVKAFHRADHEQVIGALADWFNSATAANLRAAQLELAATILPNLFGYHLVQLGAHVSKEFSASTRISHRLLVTPSNQGEVTADWDALPFEHASIDVIVAPHVLEFSPRPHAVLREAERCLIGEGYIVLSGFNPWSFYGLWRLLLGWRGRTPWSGRFRSAARVIDWLTLLGFEVELCKKVSFTPPLRREGIIRRLKFLDLLGAVAWPLFGNCYVLVARKHVAAVTPLKASWRTRRHVLAGGVAKPTTRIHKSHHDDDLRKR